MAIDTSAPRTRRALLAGGIGGVAALVASALGRPLPARAASAEFDSSDDSTPAVRATHTWAGTGVLASSYSGAGVLTSSTGGTGLVASSVYGDGVIASGAGSGDGLVASSDSGAGVRASSNSGDGVRASSDSASGVGVYGYSPVMIGVWGQSFSGFGVEGTSAQHCGVKGESGSGFGVYGYSDANYGVFGENDASGTPAIMGRSDGKSTGCLGYSGPNPLPAAPARTGVYGYAAQDTTARGVTGQTTVGRGVNGQATSGVGAYGYATTGTGGSFATSTGYALRTSGRVRIDKASGVATVLAGSTSALVKPGLDVTSSSFVLLTPRGNLGGRDLWYSVNATTNEFTIRVSTAPSADLKVGWLLLG